MKIASDATQWKIRAMFLEKANNELRGVVAKKDLEVIATKDQLLEANIQNALLAERHLLGIPDNWIYHVDKGEFVAPENIVEGPIVNMGERPGAYRKSDGIMIPQDTHSTK